MLDRLRLCIPLGCLALLPACPGDKNSEDSESTNVTSSEPTGECQMPAKVTTPYFTSNVEDRIDEPCTVTASQATGDTLALGLMCPMAGPVTFTLQGGPQPDPAPQVGETLTVFHQRKSTEPLDFPQLGMLFLRSGAQLRYGVADGFLFSSEETAALAAGLQPLTLALEAGPCPLVPTFEGDSPPAGDSWVCAFEALAQVRLGFADEPPLVRTEGTSSVLTADADTYLLDVRLARRGEKCIDFELDSVELAIALQPAP